MTADDPAPVAYFSYADKGTGRDEPRPGFERLMGTLNEPHDGPRGVMVASLDRLFRTRRDRKRVDALIRDGLQVGSAREEIATEKQGGMARYETFADLLMLAYEGDWPMVAGCSRHEIADAFADDVLSTWLQAWGASEDQLARAVEDVRNRLHALVARWDHPEAIDPLLAPFLELAVQHEPCELPVRLRALALVGVRNSALEDLHLADVIHQDDWRMLTQAAAYALARIAEMPVDDRPVAADPFAGILEDHPTATAAFTVLATMSPGQELGWTRPDAEPPAIPEGQVQQRLLPDGHEVRHAMEGSISFRLAGFIRQLVAEPGIFAVPSLKQISRNPQTLFQIVDVLLAHGSTIATANLQLTPDRIIWREDVAGYNETDMRWTGLPGIPADLRMRAGRNDPCPCGSGRKFKRCCGQPDQVA